MSQFLINCIDNDALDHETLIRRILDQLPSEAFLLLDQYSWAIAEGHILKGARAVIWGRIEDGNRHFNNAANVDAHIDEYFLNALTHKLLDYEVEFGSEAAQSVLRNIESFLRKLPDVNVRSMFGSYYVNRAFQYFHEGEYAHAKRMLVHAIGNDPKYVTNRGVLSVFFRSLLRS
jgi:tetratricopeptide (TPR) repeat protein